MNDDSRRLVVVDGAGAAARTRFSRRHVGLLMGMPRRAAPSPAGAAFFGFAGGRIGDVWVLGDLAALAEQLRRNARETG